MPFIDWLPAYSVGNQTIDDQHKELLEMVNRLHLSIVKNKVDEEVAQVLKDLIAYTQYHFDEEENYMHQAGFPHLKEHMKIHREIINSIGGYLMKLKNGQKVSVFQLISFLRDWLTKHILVEDMKYKTFIENSEIQKKEPVPAE